MGELEVAVGGWGVDGGGGKCGSNEWERDGMRWLLKGERAHNLLNRSCSTEVGKLRSLNKNEGG